MDMTGIHFPRGRFEAGRSAEKDFGVLVATLQALQLATATARAQVRWGSNQSEVDSTEGAPLAEILLGTTRWQQAVVAQQGSFNPAFARVTAE